MCRYIKKLDLLNTVNQFSRAFELYKNNHEVIDERSFEIKILTYLLIFIDKLEMAPTMHPEQTLVQQMLQAAEILTLKGFDDFITWLSTEYTDTLIKKPEFLTIVLSKLQDKDCIQLFTLCYMYPKTLHTIVSPTALINGIKKSNMYDINYIITFLVNTKPLSISDNVLNILIENTNLLLPINKELASHQFASALSDAGVCSEMIQFINTRMRTDSKNYYAEVTDWRKKNELFNPSYAQPSMFHTANQNYQTTADPHALTYHEIIDTDVERDTNHGQSLS